MRRIKHRRRCGNGHYLINCIFKMQTDSISDIETSFFRFDPFYELVCKLLTLFIFNSVFQEHIAPNITPNRVLYIVCAETISNDDLMMIEYFGRIRLMFRNIKMKSVKKPQRFAESFELDVISHRVHVH